ncbi:MAG: CoA pyrophosphatase [Burkholderiales bacterium]
MTKSPSSLPNFDPRKIPVVGVDAHLPPVAADRLLIDAIRARFVNPPPWQPEVVQEPKFMDRQPARAAVLVPIVLRKQPTVLLTERTAHLSTHSGQVAFPGGKADECDADAAATALREAHEEVGLESRFVDVIGTLPTYLTGSSFTITPVVGLVDPAFELQINEYEVAAAFEVPLLFLMTPANHRRHTIEWEGFKREWFSMPWQDHDAERFIWGATAGMLRNFYRFLSA